MGDRQIARAEVDAGAHDLKEKGLKRWEVELPKDALEPRSPISRLFERMIARIGETIVEEEDRVRVYRLCEGCRKEVKILGQGMLTEDPEVYIV